MTRYLAYGIVFLLMAIIGLVITIFIYPFRKSIRRKKSNWFFKFLWFFLNDTKDGRDAGDYGRFNHNFIGYYRQCAIRNPHWNLKLALSPEKGLLTEVKGNNLTFYNLVKPIKFGTQFATYKIKGKKYFRYSFNRKFLNRVFNLQLGAASNRYVYKFRINKL